MFRRVLSQNPWLIPFVTRVHRGIYRATGGIVGGSNGNTKPMLLTTVGRKSGLTRVTPLLYVEGRDQWVVVASNSRSMTSLQTTATPENHFASNLLGFPIKDSQSDPDPMRE